MVVLVAETCESNFAVVFVFIMPALDLEMINNLGRELHPSPNGLMAEDEVCPWTLFLTMALTLLKGKENKDEDSDGDNTFFCFPPCPLPPGVLPHVPRVLPMVIQDEEMRERVAETFMSEEFNNNIENYFVQNIKVSVCQRKRALT